jgi:hypothetical protein
MKSETKRGFTLHYNQVLAISFTYLVLPFLIFCLGFIKIYLAVPVVLLFAWLAYRNFRQHSRDERQLIIPYKTLVITLALTLVWVWLSGIGGFAFQNTDFHIRNAIFRDLITHDWPVRYFSDPLSPTTPYTLIYYIGFWLPAALVGKLGGWLAANIALYVWTVLGILLALSLVAFKVKLSLPKLLLLFVFFSGMDALGSAIKLAAIPDSYNPLWPPISSIEWWVFNLQYSSFTTQLYWVFNQALPAWICMALLFTVADRSKLLLLWALCCFFAPLPAIGMFPFVLLKIPHSLFESYHIERQLLPNNFKEFFTRLRKDIIDLFTLENILGGGIVLAVTFFYFASNVQAKVTAVKEQESIRWFALVIFVLFEGLILWGVLYKHNRSNLYWYLTGLLLVTIPLIRIGSAQDFCMRGSIPMLFCLLLLTAEVLAGQKSSLRTFVIFLLIIGAYTPFEEISRSVYRTADYFIHPPTAEQRIEASQVKIYSPTITEFDHPYTLVADSFKSLGNFMPNEIGNFIAQVEEDSFFAQIVK